MNAENAKLQYEAGQNLVPYTALTDQGDHKDFRGDDELWSNKAGFKPVIRANGVVSGGAITPGAAENTVAVAALKVNLNGAQVEVEADSAVSVPRPTSTHIKYSITINASGEIAVVAGEEHTAFATDRGEDGAPPYIPLDSVEIGQVWLSSSDSALVTADEIKQVWGSHMERAEYPTHTIKHYNVSDGIIGCAGIVFASALPLIHSATSPVDGVAKAVYAQYYEPEFADIPKSSDFVPPGKSYSVSSKQIYQETMGNTSSSLNQGSFTAYLGDGSNDGLRRETGQCIFFKFFQNRLNSFPCVLSQGTLGYQLSYPAADHISAACTISAEKPAEHILG